MSLPTVTRFVHPGIVTSHFHFRNGDRIADFGSGAGFFLSSLSKAVGRDGKVYACEIKKNLVERIGQQIQEKRLPNVEALWCDLEAEKGTKLKADSLDGGVMVNVLFQLEDKEGAFREIERVLRRGGKLFVIDWTESFAGLGPHQSQVVTEDLAKKMIEGFGFVFERNFPAGEHHYGLSFRKQ